jgi:hypothetical protein
MTSAYRRDHIRSVTNDEFERLPAQARADIVALSDNLAAIYPTPVATSGEVKALRRAMARFLIDSGKVTFPPVPEAGLPPPNDALTFGGAYLTFGG